MKGKGAGCFRGQAAVEGPAVPARSLKGQAAVEYLTTYGWAILALAIVFAALISSGALTPNYLVSEECTFGTNIQCASVLYNDAGQTTFTINVFNGFPYKVKITDISIETQDGNKQVAWSGPSAMELESGVNKSITGTLSGAMVPDGAIKRFWGNITYVSCAPELGGCTGNPHVITGRITDKTMKK
jgi:hypothetical protein